RTADLPGAAVRNVPEPPWIAAMAAITLGEVEHDATGRALNLIGGLRAVPPQLRDHGPQSTNQIQRDVICNQHGSPRHSSLGGTPSADDLRGWATPVATDPRKTRDERPRGRTGSPR